MRLRTAALVALATVGCQEPDPLASARTPLQTGVEAVTFFDTKYGVPGRADPKVVKVMLPAGPGAEFGFDHIPVGTKVRVVADPKADGGEFDRPVEVNILEGDQKGKAGTIAREHLRSLQAK